MSAQITNPMAEYLLKLQLIIVNTEFKNTEEAQKYETAESKINGAAYVRAVTHTDLFESYDYDPIVLYDILVRKGYSDDRARFMANNPIIIPKDIKEELLENARAIFIADYDEPNKYYANLAGIPFKGTETIPADEIVTIPDEFYNKYRNDGAILKGQAIHELPKKYQELFMNSDLYEKTLKEHPNAKYLCYIGSNSIPIEVSRTARDGDIMRINTDKLHTYHEIFGNVSVDASIVHAYSNIYKKTRDYVYQTLRGDFSSIYANYNSLIRFLTIYMSIGACLNEFQRKSSKLIYMNNVTANNLFMLYGLPSVIMEGEPMIEFLKKFRLLLMDKGTNVVYRVKDLIGYKYTDIFSLIMVKQQKFENGIPIYNSDGTPVQDIVFRRFGTAEDNTSYFKFRETKKEYTLEEITSGDPRWWNCDEVDRMLSDMNYTLSNSKYIQLSTHMSMTDMWWQCVIFLRGMMDRNQETSTTLINVNRDINGVSSLTLYDAILSLIVMMHWLMGLKGNTYIPTDGFNCIDMLFDGLENGKFKPFKEGHPFKIASFNFDVRTTDPDRYAALTTYDYLDPDYFIPKLDAILDLSNKNTGDMLMNDIYLLYKYLETKVRESRTIREYRQASMAYNLLFLVDPYRQWYDSDSVDTDMLLCEKYGITQLELEQFKSLFPVPGSSTGENGAEEVKPELEIVYNEKKYKIFVYDIMNEDVYDLEVPAYPINDISVNPVYENIFRDPNFVAVFDDYVLHDDELITMIRSSNVSATIRNEGIDIIIDKVNIDVGSSAYGPTTFDTMLMMENPKLHEYLSNIWNHGEGSGPENTVMLLRSIIKALEEYTNASLSSLEAKAIGVDEYMRVLREVITYFKSYMVEFTKEEFIYMFGGVLDNGGNSDMLKLVDEISNGSIIMSPVDSLTLYDVSKADVYVKMADDNVGMMYDDVLFRLATRYSDLQGKGYDMWYDDGKRITQTPSFRIDDDAEVIANVVNAGGTTKIIVNVENVKNDVPTGYYGNVL